MARVDWSEYGSGYVKLKPGAYHVEVLEAEERTSKNGDPMVSVKLGAVDWKDAHICYDILMLGGKGRNMGTAKLVALGVEKGTPEISAPGLVGRRAYAYIVEGEWQGKKRLEVDISEGSHCGYWLEGESADVPDLMRPDADAADDAAQGAFDDNPFGADDAAQAPF